MQTGSRADGRVGADGLVGQTSTVGCDEMAASVQAR